MSSLRPGAAAVSAPRRLVTVSAAPVMLEILTSSPGMAFLSLTTAAAVSFTWSRALARPAFTNPDRAAVAFL